MRHTEPTLRRYALPARHGSGNPTFAWHTTRIRFQGDTPVHFPDPALDLTLPPIPAGERWHNLSRHLPAPGQPLHVAQPTCSCRPTVSWLSDDRLWTAPVLDCDVIAWTDASCGPRHPDGPPDGLSPDLAKRWRILKSVATEHLITDPLLPRRGQPLMLLPYSGGVVWLSDHNPFPIYAPQGEDELITWSPMAEHYWWFMDIDEDVVTTTFRTAASSEVTEISLSELPPPARSHHQADLTVQRRHGDAVRVDYHPTVSLSPMTLRSAAAFLLHPALTAGVPVTATASVTLPDADEVTADRRVWRPTPGLDVVYEPPFTITLHGVGSLELTAEDAHRVAAAFLAAEALHTQSSTHAVDRFAQTQADYSQLLLMRDLQRHLNG